jgi:hypothetical protein
MKLRLGLATLIVLGLFGLGGKAFASSPTLLGPHPQVTRLADGLALDWRLPQPALASQADGRVQLVLDGFDPDGLPGQAELPTATFLVALPPGAAPTLDVIQSAETRLDLPGSLVSVSATDLTTPSGDPFVPEPAPRSVDLPLVELRDLGDLRGVRLALLTLRPAHLQSGVLSIASAVSLELRFHTTPAASTALDADLYRQLAGIVLNPQHLRRALAVVSPTNSTQAAAFQAAIEVSAEGLYQVGYADLLAAVGSSLSQANPNTLHLTQAGADIPFEWIGDADGAFESSESLAFYARPRFSRWSVNDVYFLSSTAQPRLAMPGLNAAPGSETQGMLTLTQVFEQNLLYTPDCLCSGALPLNRDGDRWVWSLVPRDQVPSASQSYPFTLANPDPAKAATITLWLVGKTDTPQNPDHRVTVSLNGATLGSVEWDGRQAIERSFSVPTGKLAGSNTLTLTLPGIAGVNIEEVWLDAFSLRYEPNSTAWSAPLAFSGEGGANRLYKINFTGAATARVYDVTDSLAPVRLSGMSVSGSSLTLADKAAHPQPRYLILDDSPLAVPAKIRPVRSLLNQGIAGAKWIAIAPADFIPALQPLVNLRQSQGLSAVVEDLGAIYDQYGQGLPTPQAIQAYLQDVYSRWSPQPVYLTLVGDGTIDPRRYLADSFPTLLPPYLADFDPFSTEGASDNRFATLGGVGDIIPDLLVGRLPANSIAEVTGMVDKIVQYEANPEPGSWKNTAVFTSAVEDFGGPFQQVARAQSALLNCTMPSEHLFYTNDAAINTGLKAELLDDWNNGAGLIVFNGHASIHFWASYVYQPGSVALSEIFHYNQIAGLTNGGRLPVVLSMTCFTGSFQTPDLQTLDEGLVRFAGGGALASWGSTSLGLSVGHEFLAQGFIGSLVGQPAARLGGAALAGKLNLLAKKPSNAYLVDSYILFGDPASLVTYQKSNQCLYIARVSTGGIQ